MPRILLVAIGVAILIRTFYWLDYRSSPLFDTAAGPDVKEYHEWASQILAGQWLWQDVPLHGPGYAYFLSGMYALTSSCLPVVRALQLVMGILGLVAVCLATGKRIGSLAAACTAFVWAVHIPLVYYEAELFSESLACFLHCLVLALLIGAAAPVSRWRCAAVGLLLGLSIITHPTAVILTLLMTAWLAWDAWRGRHERTLFWLNPLVTLACAGLVVLPVAVHNSRLAGRLVLVQRHDGLNFYVGNNPKADGTPNVRFGPPWDRLLQMPRVEAGVQQESERRAFYFDKAFAFIRGSTPKWLALTGRKIALALNAREVTASTPVAALRPDIWLLRLPPYGFAVLLALSAVGLRSGGWRLPPAWILILAFLITQSIFVAAGRYRAPMLPAMFVLAGLGLQHLIEMVRARDRSEILRTTTVAIVALLFAFLPVVPVGNNYPAEAALARATAYQTKDNWPAVVEELQAGVAQRPDHVPSQINLGQALDRLGRTDEALPHFEKAVAVEPDYPWALAALGYALAERGDADTAITYFRRALDHDPTYLDAHMELAKLFSSLGRGEESAEHYQYFVLRRPDDVEARLGLVGVLRRHGQDQGAARWLQDGLKRFPNNVEFHVQLGRLRAASADEAVRNPQHALAWARRAAKLIHIETVVRQVRNRDRKIDPRASEVLDGLAMAYAANGSYDLATKTASLAMGAAELSGQDGLKPQIASRLELYRQQKPYRDAAVERND
jgi:tetratricopeptide (TPR) repeat protein